MKIYDAELLDGLGDIINSNMSVAYTTQLFNAEPVDFDISKFKNLDLAKATNKDSFDLHHIQAILVTTNWNENDDIFIPREVWAARHTPEDKPVNLEHDPDTVLGHITDCWAIDDEYKLIDDSTKEEDLPQKFHLLTSAVIYKYWHNEELLTDIVNKLITGIEAGEYFVSMECLVNDFGYGIVGKEGSVNILERNKDTAFLTKYLRCFGGTGVYRDKRIGRVLKNIVFSGKGFTKRPANKESKILPKEKNIFASNKFIIPEKMVYILSNENSNFLENVMSDNLETFKLLKDENDNLKKAVAEAADRVVKLEAELKKLDAQAVEAKYTKLENDIAIKEEKIAALEKLIAENKSVIEAGSSELENAKATISDLTKKIEDAAKAEKARIRTEQLVSAGLTVRDAKEKLEKFASLDDEQFAEVVKIFTKPEGSSDVKPVEASKVIDTAEPNKNEIVTPSAKASEKDDFADLRKDFLSTFFPSFANNGEKV